GAAVRSIGCVLELSGRWRIERSAGRVRTGWKLSEDCRSAATGWNLIVGGLHRHLQVDAVVHVVPQFERQIPDQFAGDAEAALDAVGVLVVGNDTVTNRSSRC